MSTQLKFEFDFDEVFEGIKQGTIREIAGMKFDEAKDIAIYEIKKEIMEKFSLTYKDESELIKEINGEIKEKVFNTIIKEIKTKYLKKYTKTLYEETLYDVIDEIKTELVEKLYNDLNETIKYEMEEKITDAINTLCNNLKIKFM